MDHPPHVRFVDPHPESDGRTDDVHFVAQEEFLRLGSDIVRQPCVIRPRCKSASCQRRSQAFRCRACRAIDDATLLFAPAREIKNLPKRLILRNHLVGEIRTIEARDENGWVS